MATRDPNVDYRVHRGQDVIGVPAGSLPLAPVWYQRRFETPTARKCATVVLYADAACVGDFGGCGYVTSTGCYGLSGGHYPPAITGPMNSTIQELRAIACGFPAAMRWRGNRPIVIRSDSLSAIEYIARWRDGEPSMPTGYVTDRPTAKRGAVTTLEWLAAQIAGLGTAVITEHVRGHSGELLQEMVDGLARKGLRCVLGHGTVARMHRQADDFARQFLISAGYTIGDLSTLNPRVLDRHAVLEAYAEPGAPGYALRGRVRSLYADLYADLDSDVRTEVRALSATGGDRSRAAVFVRLPVVLLPDKEVARHVQQIRRRVLAAGYSAIPLRDGAGTLIGFRVTEAYQTAQIPGEQPLGEQTADLTINSTAGDGASTNGAHAACRGAPPRSHGDGRADGVDGVGGASRVGGACENDAEDVDGTSPSAWSAAFRARPGSEAVESPFAGPAMGRLVG